MCEKPIKFPKQLLEENRELRLQEAYGLTKGKSIATIGFILIILAVIFLISGGFEYAVAVEYRQDAERFATEARIERETTERILYQIEEVCHE